MATGRAYSPRFTVHGSLSTVYRYDVALVGYGPVGALLAVLLGGYGLRVLVLEKEMAPSSLPRAAHLDDEALRVLQAAGAHEPVLAASRPLDGMDLVTEGNEVLLRLRKVGARAEPYGFPAANLVHQPLVEQTLRERAGEHPNVELRLGHALEAAAQDDAAVTLDVTGPEGRYRVRAAWAIGCDGARSLVRGGMRSPLERVVGRGRNGPRAPRSGSPENLYTDGQPWLVVDVRLRRDVALPYRLLQVCDARRPTTYVPFPDPRKRWEFRLRPGETAEEIERPEAVRQLLADWVDPDAVEVERAAVYTFRALVARYWRNGRLLLAGDAAHQMPPFLGQGLGAGVRDAHNLAWKLALVARGAADEALLDSYAAERRPHVEAVTRLAVRVGRLIQLGGTAARLRDRLVPLLHRAAPLRRLLTEREHDVPRIPLAFAGTALPRRPLLPQPWIETPDGARARLDPFLGAGFALVGLGLSPRRWAQPADLPLWRTLVTRAVHVVPPDAPWPATAEGEAALRDGDVLKEWVGQDGVVLVVRSDRHLFGVYGPDEGGRAAAALREALRLR